jgi:hypothetical protein
VGPREVQIPALAEKASEETDQAPEEPQDPYAIVAVPSEDEPQPFDDVRPRARRHTMLKVHRPPAATAPEVAASEHQRSRYRGFGPGAHGGPGGPGRGWGYGNGNRVVNNTFAFGGPQGAFRADVCFITANTRSLKTVTRCPREVTFFTNQINVSPRKFSIGFPGVTQRNEWFAIRYKGRFTVREPGQYTFRLVSDDGAMLYVDGYAIIDNDGIHPPRSQLGNMRLTAGDHKLFVSYFQGPRYDIALQLYVTPPGGRERILGPSI